ncbi:MAG TPA: pyridoxamine 5'-phosphate oxidase family protein [Candidatus Margulisiibacteriota bacterium]|nr:pyridoxamine 5'-phosphate oxidase family protein [Candidatus Margulisiibacteriota bacterium]
MRLTEGVVNFFQGQGYVIVSTIDKKGFPHNACKGIVEIDREGAIYLFDLYKGLTFANLSDNPRISITAVDEHKFIGYSLKGKARLVFKKEMKESLIKSWEDRIAGRLTSRVIRNMREEKGHPHHPEALLPRPEYLIQMQAEEVIDLTPGHIKGER